MPGSEIGGLREMGAVDGGGWGGMTSSELWTKGIVASIPTSLVPQNLKALLKTTGKISLPIARNKKLLKDKGLRMLLAQMQLDVSEPIEPEKITTLELKQEKTRVRAIIYIDD